MVYLVRHAHAGRKALWPGPDIARPLTAAGRQQAAGLIDRLRGYPVNRILSSPANRCLQTVQPLAGHRGLRIEVADALADDSSAHGVLELIEDKTLSGAVLCTHGEVIARIFKRLRAEGLELGPQPRWAKGSTWVLDRDGGRVSDASYLEPLAAS